MRFGNVNFEHKQSTELVIWCGTQLGKVLELTP